LALLPAAARGAQPENVSARDLYLQSSGTLLGIKCRLLLRDGSGRFVAAGPDSVFHTSQHIRLEVETNVPGFLYVLQQGSDTTWQVLFPSAEIRDNNNRVAPAKAVMVPRTEDFFFDEVAGKEHLFLVLARAPEPDLERLLELVRSRAANQAAGRQDDAAPSLYKSLSVKMTGDLASRNLRTSKTGDQETDPLAQNAIYVVNTERSEARVVCEVVLTHER
jgi:hypothetical protein